LRKQILLQDKFIKTYLKTMSISISEIGSLLKLGNYNDSLLNAFLQNGKYWT